MAPLGRLACTFLAAGSLTGSCLSDLDDSAALFQRGRQLQYASQDPDRTFLKDPMPEFRERDEFEHYKDPNEVSTLRLGKKQKNKVEINPFKDMITNINLAIDSVKDGLESSTREVVHQAVAEMKDTATELSNQLKQSMHEAIQKELTAASSAQAASLLELGALNSHKPKLEVNASSSSKKKKKAKIEFNPFKDLISGINQAIDTVKDGLESTTRDIVHQAAQELKTTGQELTHEIEQMQKDVMGTVSAPGVSLLDIGEVSMHKPKAQVNVTASTKKKKAKIEFNPFKDMIEGINSAIDSIKDNLETSTRDLVHEAAADLKKAGEELKTELDETLHKSMGEMAIVTAAPTSV